MERVAIIGTGIAGMACAHHLHPHVEVTLLEKDTHVGGHTRTVTVETPDGPIPVDTGFMVYNEATYPGLCALFRELEIPTRATTMAFGLDNRLRGFTWSSANWPAFLSRPRNLIDPRTWLLVRDILRFNRAAQRFVADEAESGISLKDFLDREGLGQTFVQFYLLPMTSAIWSTPRRRMLDFPALSLLRFLDNHALLQVRGHHPWRVVEGGSCTYRDRLLEPLRKRLYPGRGVSSVAPAPQGGAWVRDEQGALEHFDRVVIATHADQALDLLETPTLEQDALLSPFRYNRSTVQLHSDPVVMPRDRRFWAAWNYRVEGGVDGGEQSSTHYWMNALQHLPTKTEVFVSLDARHLVRPEHVYWEHTTTHPYFTYAAIAAQNDLPRLNRNGPIRFCGSYFGAGFHEDGYQSGGAAARSILAAQQSLDVIAV